MKKYFYSVSQFTLLLLAGFAATFCIAEPIQKAQFWATGVSTSRATYESLLAEELLKKTEAEYGPYNFGVNYLQVNYDRGRRVVAEGRVVNFFTNPLPARKLEIDRELSVIHTPVMHGLLGYRVLIVRKDNLEKFKRIENYSDLQKFKAGQVNFWADVPVYEENGLPLVLSSSFESLFFMLSRGRFDYIPLSVGEARQTLEEISTQYDNLVIVPDIVIYYPFPVFFQASKHYPELTVRLRKGMQIAQSDGTLDKLFNHYFHDVLTELNSENIRLFRLTNSNLPAGISVREPELIHTNNIVLAPGVVSIP
ncbi:type 2 periplasmic-binding domain-containing protein [Teredinibacter purpureus]|uniref:ABC transporter substrate-binding protein n=1 Tax=Teredinibacter purpureus TaxID=2731756 RepID=UPI0006965473|nr:ABC transporter substrate-binding protein [Teredinibacter purpureus]